MKLVVSISWTLDKEKAMADKKASFLSDHDQYKQSLN